MNASFSIRWRHPAAAVLLTALAATASTAPQACIGNFKDDSVSVIDTARGVVVATIPVAAGPHGMLLSPDGATLCVSGDASSALSVVDTASGRVVRTLTVVRELPLAKPPRDRQFAFDGRALYFTLAGENAVQVLDPATDAIVARVPTGASPHIAGRFCGAASGVAVVQGPGEVLLFDASTNATLRSTAVDRKPHRVAASAGGGLLYVTNEGSNEVTNVDVGRGQTRSVAVGAAPRKLLVQQTSAELASASGVQVSIAGFAFAPADTVIEAGSSVVWSNDDGAPHGLAFRDRSAGADRLLPGARSRASLPRPALRLRMSRPPVHDRPRDRPGAGRLTRERHGGNEPVRPVSGVRFPAAAPFSRETGSARRRPMPRAS